MLRFRFDREFRRWLMKARANCVLCKAMTLVVFKPGVCEIDEETAAAAAEAGAGAVLDPADGAAP